MNPTLDQLMASSRADEIRWLERTASERPSRRRFRRLSSAARRSSQRAGS